MFKVMIVDDEKIAIDSLQYIIEKNFNDIKIIATARSGREAIEKVENSIPDIVFMDIRMPGISGLDAIKEIKKHYKQVIIIVLTGFDQFEFAKEALNLGVMEYLLKPVNRAKIIEVIQKAIEIIKVEKEKRQSELQLKERLELVVPILENGFIYSMILFEDASAELLNYKQIFEIKESGGYVLTVEFGDEENSGELKNKIGYSVRSHNFYPLFRDIVSSLQKCIIGPVMLNRIVIFIPTNHFADEFTARLEAVTFSETLLQRLSEKLNYNFRIGIGRIYENYELLHSSYEDSVRALRYLNSSGVMHIMDSYFKSSKEPEYPEDKERLLLQKISHGDIAESLNLFNFIFDWLLSEYREQPLKLKNKLLEIIFLINRMALDYDNDAQVNGIGILEEMLSIESTTELKLWCKVSVENVVSQMNNYRNNKVGGVTKKAKEYIKANFSNAITLDDLSRELNVSPQYFSKLFKEETGVNFIDYITNIRIKIAKEQLENTDLSIKEICYNIGYSDPNYFSRNFKKIVGVTPTEYKESIS